MTRDEILNMPAGREMDVIVLRDILKYRPVYVQEGSLFGAVGELDCWYDENEKFLPLGTSPSSDISIAFDAVECVYLRGLQREYVSALCSVMVHDYGKTSLSREYHANAHQQVRACLLSVMEEK